MIAGSGAAWSTVGYDRRRGQLEQALASSGMGTEVGGVLERRLDRHLQESRRVDEFVRLLPLGDGSRLGELLNESHSSLTDLMEVCSPELDDLRRLAFSSSGCLKVRLMVGGFGGASVALASRGKEEDFSKRLGALIGCGDRRVTVDTCDPADGACV